MTGLYLTYEDPAVEADAWARSEEAGLDLERLSGDAVEQYPWPVEEISTGVWRLEVLHPALLTEAEKRRLTGLPNEAGNSGFVGFPSGESGSLNGGAIMGFPTVPTADS